MYEFDDSRSPLLISRVRGVITDAELTQFCRDLDAIVERAEPFAILYDITDVPIPPRAQIMEVLAWNRRLRARYIELYDEANPPIPSFAAYHMPSMLGNLLRFFLQMVPSTRGQMAVCNSYDEALRACELALERMELDHPPHLAAG